MDGLSSVASTLRDHASVLVVVHVQADLDALGSALGLALSLDAESTVVVPGGVKERAGRLPQALAVDLHAPDDVSVETADCVVVVDASSAERIAPVSVETATGDVVVVDHHEPGDLVERATASYVVSDAGATAVLVAEVLDAMHCSMPPAAAVALAAGVLDDTGSLAGASPAEFRCLGRLLEAAGEQTAILPRVLAHEPSFSERVAAVTGVVRATGYRADRTLVLLTEVNGEQRAVVHALRSAGADVALVFSDREDRVWVVGRVRGDTLHLPDDLFAPLVDRFGGDSGGHAGAGVAKLDTDALDAVREAALEQLATHLDDDLTPLS